MIWRDWDDLVVSGSHILLFLHLKIILPAKAKFTPFLASEVYSYGHQTSRFGPWYGETHGTWGPLFSICSCS